MKIAMPVARSSIDSSKPFYEYIDTYVVIFSYSGLRVELRIAMGPGVYSASNRN
jgi:hypothetical protein